jgi:hypothetical protein
VTERLPFLFLTFELFGIFVRLGFSDDPFYICLSDMGYKLSRNRNRMKEFFFNFTGNKFHGYFLAKKRKRQEIPPAFFHKHLLIYKYLLIFVLF